MSCLSRARSRPCRSDVRESEPVQVFEGFTRFALETKRWVLIPLSASDRDALAGDAGRVALRLRWALRFVLGGMADYLRDNRIEMFQQY
ncbi:hypothetical protein ALO72_200013 [Pseudomonas syringae pv. delphinii]|nr:hypothetical protein ALO72_200013 [Pseudomonas syringae pv. delphinii]